MSSPSHCRYCSKVVSERHQAVSCDSCGEWQHRGCDTGISRYQYQKMRKGDVQLEFKCVVCRQDQHSVLELPAAESTRLSLAEEITADAEPRVNVDMTVQQETMDIEESVILPPVPLPAPLEESSIIDVTVIPNDVVTVNQTFTLVPRGTSRGKDMLVEAPGYSYTIRKVTETTKFWWCSVRRKGNRCPASVSQRGNVFIRGRQNHTHPTDPDCLLDKKLTRQIKDTAAENVFTSAMSVVENTIQSVDPAVVENIPKPDNLVRKANRFRQAQRPSDPTVMDFELAMDHIPEDFLQADITVDGARHILFSTTHQLELLSRAKTWYLDGTFKVIRTKDVFEQLFGIHAFFKSGDSVKQLPLVFVFMSRKRKKDYKKILKKLKELLPVVPLVQSFVLDFEAAVWKALQSVFPQSRISGCAFHWTQAVWKRVQACGLTGAYNAGGGIQKVVRRLLALPLLPAEHIRTAFADQERKAINHEELTELFRYVHDQWIVNPLWSPEDWSVYGQPIRTNNDCEGWHRRLNSRTAHPPPFYVLVQMLQQEASFVRTQIKLINMNKLTKKQRKATREMQGRIFKVWDSYSGGGISTGKLLKSLARVYSV